LMEMDEKWSSGKRYLERPKTESDGVFLAPLLVGSLIEREVGGIVVRAPSCENEIEVTDEFKQMPEAVTFYLECNLNHPLLKDARVRFVPYGTQEPMPF
ncbi:MAG: hypothetical protein GX784_01990, partial [Firmicutes bacterium]|nr:hypothetical protein [Candidatus Fermentithermobacillaceae bacterium]